MSTAIAVTGDVANSDDVKKVISETEKNFGRVTLSISFSSSCQPCPEAWIGASAAVTTWAPIWKIRSIVSLTERSLPGIGVAEKITVSPASTPAARLRSGTPPRTPTRRRWPGALPTWSATFRPMSRAIG